jgi:hypothetical protein
LSIDIFSVTRPENEIDAIPPVIVGKAEGSVDVGSIDGITLGNKVGAAVIKIFFAPAIYP